MKIQKLGSDKL